MDQHSEHGGQARLGTRCRGCRSVARKQGECSCPYHEQRCHTVENRRHYNPCSQHWTEEYCGGLSDGPEARKAQCPALLLWGCPSRDVSDPDRKRGAG